MIRVRNKPKAVRVSGRVEVVIEIHPGGLVRVREARRRTWYDTTAEAILWQAARAQSVRDLREKAELRKARRIARRSGV